MTTTKAPAERRPTRPTVSAAEQARRTEARDAKLADLHTRLATEVTAITTGDDWTRWLTIAGRFHHYSFGNLLLIAAQRPDATQVAGFETWKSMGRHVSKGERGIAILAPVVRKVDTEDGGQERRVVGFRITYVWDVAQTTGDPLPEQPMPTLLAGEAPAGLWDALTAAITAAGFTVERGSCGHANGTTDFTARVVRVRDDVDAAQAVKTLAHEYGHVMLHAAAGVLASREVQEVEAESVAYLITAAYGMASDGYTFPYVACWAASAKGTEPEEMVRRTATRVLKAARDFLGSLTQDDVEQAA